VILSRFRFDDRWLDGGGGGAKHSAARPFHPREAFFN